jgi:hypothetical protein
VIAYAPGTIQCTIADSRITEASGMVASDREDGVVFVHNDSGDTARFFALGPDCATRATFTLPGVQARDWEDVARGPGHVLWFGDIGDNRALRKSVVVRRVAEPLSTRSAALPATTYRLGYPDGAHDAETLLADPIDGRLYVLTKRLDGSGTLYAAPLPLVPDTVNALTRLESVSYPLGSLAPTGGDISPDGSKLVIRTYGDAFEVRIPAGKGTRLAHVFKDGPGERVDLPGEKQGEAIAYSRDGRSLLTTSEGSFAPLHVLAADPTPTPSTSSAPVVTKDSKHQPWRLLVLLPLAAAVFVLRRRR